MDKQQGVIAMIDKGMPSDLPAEQPDTVNHLAWSLLAVAVLVIAWLTIALINAENQRNAYASGLCKDPLFKNEVEALCLKSVDTREHWWQHIGYAMTHLNP